MSWFVSGTSTGVGKTFVSRGLAAALRERGHSIRALKPIETGCTSTEGDAVGMDAAQLAEAAGDPSLATAPGFYRALAPLSPVAVAQRGEAACDLTLVADQTRSLMSGHLSVVEGAGGLLVPITARETTCDLIAALKLPVVLVADDGLGVLSHVLSAATVCQHQNLQLACVVLNRMTEADSQRENLPILKERLFVPVIPFHHTEDNLPALAKEAERSGLVEVLLTSLGGEVAK